MTKPCSLGFFWLHLSWPHFLPFSFFSVLHCPMLPLPPTAPHRVSAVSCLQHQVVTTLIPASVCRPALRGLLLRNFYCFPQVLSNSLSPLSAFSCGRLSRKAVSSSGRFNLRPLQAIFPKSHIQVIMSGSMTHPHSTASRSSFGEAFPEGFPCGSLELACWELVLPTTIRED